MCESECLTIVRHIVFFIFHFVIFLLHCAGIQCLMYLYHYPDIWYDYATWHAKSGSVDAAVKVFQRALKALPGNLHHVLCVSLKKFLCHSSVVLTSLLILLYIA